LREGMDGLSSFRLLLGDEPEVEADLGLREAGAKPVKGLIRELDEASFNEKTLQMIEGLITFLRQEHVLVRLYTKTFLHAKCYLFYGDSDFVRLAPDTAIVGSSNFTRAGLFTSRELNLVHRATLAASIVSRIAVWRSSICWKRSSSGEHVPLSKKPISTQPLIGSESCFARIARSVILSRNSYSQGINRR